jgi:5'-nucleotidase
VNPVATSLLLAALVCADFSSALARPLRRVEVQLLAINDLHGYLEPPAGAQGEINHVPAGGVEYLATHLERAAQEHPATLLVGAGDMIGASPLLSSMFDDAPTIETLNAMHMAVTAIGNHELDKGAVVFQRKIEGLYPREDGCPDGRARAAASYQYLAGNVVLTDTGAALAPATAVRTVGGIKIGFIGETLQGTGAIISPRAANGLDFQDESRVANAAAAKLERQGVHAIVLLIHQGGQQNPAAGVAADPNGCVNFQGDLAPILPKLAPSIKVVISGHTHQFYNCRIAGRVVTSASAFGRMFTRMTLQIDPRTDRILSVEAVNQVVTRDVPKDGVQTAILDKYRSGLAQLAGRVVGSTSGKIVREQNHAAESAMGDVIADSLREEGPSSGAVGAQVAFINSGGLRASLDAAGPVTYGELFAIQPFADHIDSITLTGDMIRRLLEQQFHATGHSDILQVSKGFTYRYRLDAPPGRHVAPGSIALDGRPIAPGDKVRVATSEFLAQGGNGFTVFAEGADAEMGNIDVDAVARYFTAHSPLAPGPIDRITRTD